MANDWQDPFAEDEAARERERRRAEREARREERRRALADRVREERPVLAPERPARPADASPQQEATAQTDGSEPPPAAPARPRAAAGGRAGVPPPDVLRRRRIFGLLLVLGAVAGLALLAYGVAEVADRLGSSDDPAPAAPQKLGTITIPEGLDREQIAQTVKEAGVGGDYLKETQRFKGFDPGRYGAENPDSLEGFLFPATYELPRKAKVDDLISRQLDAFRDRMRGIDMRYAESKNLTEYDVVIIASMIEREVQVPEERPLVAAVIYNRLSQGMPLQIDATVRFATGNFESPLTESELATPSPYNTYESSGLPPGPIGNPGEDSLKAAANPANEDHLFYVVKPGTCGEHVFTASEAEFNRAVEEYRQAQEAAGGSPTEC
jgi:cell division protein YceG involved in septum cleavage